MAVLTDTTVLSNFAQARRPDLLQRAFPDLLAPPAVLAELRTGERLGRVPICDWSWLGVIQLTESENAYADGLRPDLGPGEASCLALVRSRGLFLLTDDGNARRVAQSLQGEISGTLGVLAKLVRREILSLDQADDLLATMRRRGYRSPVRSISVVV
jgi:predicted nucleic acid-binding protein